MSRHDLLPTAVAATLVLLAGCSGTGSDAQHNKQMIQDYVAAMTRGDASYLDQYLGPNYVYHGPNGDMDAEQFRALHQRALAAFPGATATVENMVAEGDEVATRWTLRGTHQAPFLGVPATGKEITIEGIIISRFAEGKAVEEWEQLNVGSILQQLGAMPASPAAGQ